MRTLAVFLLGFALWSFVAAAATTQVGAPPVPPVAPAPAADDPQPAAAPQGIILYVNRNLEVRGHLESEDDNVITIRNLKGASETFSKTRVLQIVRLVQPQPQQPGTVVMRDGQTRNGIIIEDAFDHVLIEIEGIRAKLKRANVSHVVLQPTVLERYRQFKDALKPGMTAAHLALCQWLVDHKEYELARRELLALLEAGEDADARQLLRLVEAQLALRERGEGGAAPIAPEGSDQSADTADDGAPAGPVTTADLMPTELLTRDDVNIMRVYEIDFENPPKVVITPDLVRTLIETFGTNKLVPSSQTGRNAMFRAAADRPIEIVRLMFELRARALYPQIDVKTEPHALNLFRQRVHDTWLINRCATTQCHGSPYAGRFFLHRRNYRDERVRYTNLLILERLNLDPAWPLINYEDPELSLIIQYAMGEAARKPHPKVDGYEPAFTPRNPRLKDESIEWIRAMYHPRPQYPVEYTPPALAGGFGGEERAPAQGTPR